MLSDFCTASFLPNSRGSVRSVLYLKWEPHSHPWTWAMLPILHSAVFKRIDSTVPHHSQKHLGVAVAEAQPW